MQKQTGIGAGEFDPSLDCFPEEIIRAVEDSVCVDGVFSPLEVSVCAALECGALGVCTELKLGFLG